MIQNNNSRNTGSNSGPEHIVLRDLVMSIWRGKVTVIVCMITTTLLSLLYIYVAKEKWVSTSIITQPAFSQFSSYYRAMNIIDSSSTSSIQETLSKRFKFSLDVLSEDLKNKERPETLTVKEEPNQLLRVSYTAQSAEEAQLALTKYIQQANNSVIDTIDIDLNHLMYYRQSYLEQSLITEEKVATEKKALLIAQIKQALLIAEQTKIKLPQIQQEKSDAPDMLFMLGSDILLSMLKNESTRPLIFPDSYYETRQSLAKINELIGSNKEADNALNGKNTYSYQYIMNPTQPINHDSQKRVITLILALLLGGMVGSSLVLWRQYST